MFFDNNKLLLFNLFIVISANFALSGGIVSGLFLARNNWLNYNDTLLRDLALAGLPPEFHGLPIGTNLGLGLSKFLHNNNFAKMIHEFQEGISSRASCVACFTMTEFYKSPIYSKAAMSTAIRTMCISLRLQKPKICHAIAHALEDELDFVGRNSKLTSIEMCSILLGVNCANDITKKLNWTVYIPPKTDTGHLPHYGPSPALQHLSATTNVIHLTDVHADLHYKQGTEAHCDEPVCCRTGYTPLDEDRAGVWGDYRKCDSPLRSVVNALEEINKSHGDAEYIYLTGDYGPHDHFSSRDEVISHVRVVTLLMKQYAKAPVFPVIGNHEGSPANSFPPPDITGSQSISWLYQMLADEWSFWLPETALRTLRYGGYYTVIVRPSFRVIVLNTNYCARLNPWSLYDCEDPGKQLQWLVSTLLEAEMAGETVHILGHIAPDSTECTRPWLNAFLNILDRFKDIIMAQFYGHSHKDEFRVYYSPDKKPIGLAFLGPSLTSFKGNNPSYRVYSVNRIGQIQNHDTYYFNLTQANRSLFPTWKLGYNFGEAYGFPTISAENLHHLINLMKINDQVFKMFYRFYSRNSDHYSNFICDELCKTDLLEELTVDDKQRPKKLTKKYN